MNYVLPRVPHEIWAQIFSYASPATLAACAQASRQFFGLAIPCLWSNIEMAHLLKLPVDAYPMDSKRVDTLEVPPPLSPSTDCFNRFTVYAAHVRTLSVLDVSGNYHRGHERAWLTTTLATLTQSLLPNLTTLTIVSRGLVNQDLHVVLDWISALAFPARNLARCHLSLNLYNPPSPHKHEVLRFLDAILSGSPQLSHLELNIAYPWDLGERPWACFNSGTIPHHLTSLTVRAHILDSNCLAWMAQLTRLRNLRICVPDPWQPAAQIPRFEGADLPVGSFPSLKRLELSTWLGFEKLFSQLWSTPIVTNLVELLIQNQSPINLDIFPIIATGSLSLRELQLAIIIYRFEVDMLAPLRSLPLRVLTISGSAPLDTNPLRAIGLLWPELEDLCL
ncbi:hypothetical protein FS749_014797 [Ceratobasidium sp. UAMH 11750]|nr:hypothetical protein FS749_014797 [Ceratobasidium sp. UAMH 11750]